MLYHFGLLSGRNGSLTCNKYKNLHSTNIKCGFSTLFCITLTITRRKIYFYMFISLAYFGISRIHTTLYKNFFNVKKLIFLKRSLQTLLLNPLSKTYIWNLFIFQINSKSTVVAFLFQFFFRASCSFCACWSLKLKLSFVSLNEFV